MAVSDMDYIREALRHAAATSHDDRTQVGAVIVVGKKLIYGSNRRPAAGVQGDKYALVEHAEREAIYKAAACGVPLAGSTMYAPWFACTDCARAIICSGISQVVGLISLRNATPARWIDNIALADRMFKAAGVGTRWVAGEAGVTIRFNGETLKC